MQKDYLTLRLTRFNLLIINILKTQKTFLLIQKGFFNIFLIISSL